ncbi:hypothetical protein BB14905_20750 [Bacillus sp. B14905]|nr:hypothetical protein BB14905_20750 [Bacillus sp. B14905]
MIVIIGLSYLLYLFVIDDTGLYGETYLDNKTIQGRILLMSLSIQQLLENKGITPKPEHLELLKARWEGMQSLRSHLEGIAIDDADIAVRSIPGGDHIDN